MHTIPQNSNSSATEKLFANPLIITQIYFHLELSDKKSLLRVNHFIHSTLISQFRQNTLIIFKTPKDVEKFTKYFSKYEAHPHTHFRFESSLNLTALARDPTEQESRRERRFRRKRNSQFEAVVLEKFFDKFALQIKSLDSHFIWGSKKQLEKLLQVFQSLQNAEELIFRPKKMNGRYLIIPTKGSLVLPKVRRLTVWHDTEVPWTSVWEIILDVFPNVEYLSLPSLDTGRPIHHHQIRFANMIIKGLTDPRPDNPWRLKYLKALCIQITEPFNFVKLAKLITTLDHLELLDGVPWSKHLNRAINCVLENHAMSLKCLKIPINIEKRKETLERDCDGNFLLPMNFPKLPELTELIVGFNMGRIQGDCLTSKVRFPMMTEINYESIFPKLETLRVNVCSSDDCDSWVESINNVFIPSSTKVSGFKSLRSLQIVSHIAKTDVETPTEEIFLNRISKTFPSIHISTFTFHPRENVVLKPKLFNYYDSD